MTGKALDGVPLLDVNDHICGDERCLLKYDDTWVFAASSHLTREFTLTQLDRVNALLSALNGGTSDRSGR